MLAVVAGPVCKGKPKPEPPKPAPKPKSFEVHGTVAGDRHDARPAITVTARGPITATCYTRRQARPRLTGVAVKRQGRDEVRGIVSNNVTTWTLRELKKDK